MEKQTYDIIDTAATYVAGKRLAPGQTTIQLTQTEADYELRAGIIALPPSTEAPVNAPVEASAETSSKRGPKAT